MKISMGRAVAGVAVLMSVAACSSDNSSSSSSVVSTPSSAASTRSHGDADKSYDLGHSVVYREALRRFTGTGTAWEKACSTVVDKWQSSVGKESWWNRDDVMRGCVDQDTGPTAAPAAKECPAKDGRTVQIYRGDITCDNAYVIASGYDFDTGGKYQQIDSVDTWNCYTTTADLRPVILSCVSDNNAEFDVASAS